MDKQKQIHIYYINKIKNLDGKIFEYEDDDYPNWRAVQICERKPRQRRAVYGLDGAAL